MQLVSQLPGMSTEDAILNPADDTKTKNKKGFY